MVWSSKLLVIFIVLVIFSNVPNCYSSYILQASNQQRDTALANYYYSKADSLNKVSLYIDANTYFNKSSILYQKSLTTKNINIFRKYIACNIKINENLRDQRKFDEAIAVLNQLLDEDIGSYDNSWKTYGKVYYEIARNLSFKGEYLAALEAYDKALQKFNIVLHGEDNLVIARIYNGKGETHEDNGDPYVAIKYYKKALGIFTTMYGSDD
ncbi:MAG: tetratricopeptide repeat protein, partial [Bacteroidia bacterium]|nr:tetratricopeptide repeat protein [Bacteroidia bacterium]